MAFFIQFWYMFVCYNGEFFPAEAPVIDIQNRSYKWGDGVFETMKVFRGKLLLEYLHFERLFSSLLLLGIERANTFSKDVLVTAVLQLAEKNNCSQHARIRLAVYRKDDNTAGYSIEAISLPENIQQWQDTGLEVVLYPFARKSTDAFANLKTANFLPYVLAQRYATEQGADDALVLNAQNFLCDSSKANLFLIKGKNLYTPALHQGCINGIMRRVVLEEAKKLGFRLHQDVVEEAQLLAAEEVFLTNAIQMIRWVSGYKEGSYTCLQTRQIFEAVSATISRSLC